VPWLTKVLIWPCAFSLSYVAEALGMSRWSLERTSSRPTGKTSSWIFTLVTYRLCAHVTEQSCNDCRKWAKL